MSSSPNINDGFFSGIYKDVWRKLIPDGLTEAECDLIMEEAALKKDSRVLDMMCGYGRHALELARRDVSVTCIDNLADYISEINSKKGALPVEAVCANATSMQLTGKYKAVICMGNSFNFFDREEAKGIVAKISAHLEEDGVFIINSWTLAEIAIKYFKEKDWFYIGEWKYLVDNKYVLDPARIETDHMIVSPDGNTETIQGVDHIFTIPELNGLLRESGLEIRAIYSTPRKRVFRFGDTRAYIVAGHISRS